MAEFNLMHEWAQLVGLIAVIGIVVTSFGVMLGIVKPSDSARHIGTILGIVLLFLILPAIVVSAWSALSFWQKMGLAALGTAVGLWRRPRRKERKRNDS